MKANEGSAFFGTMDNRHPGPLANYAMRAHVQPVAKNGAKPAVTKR
ncbi:hypothetical protein RESH_04519 [Rhodopirellula europaea SH398]|uniref:Uncharacterized protein n=1 Tax=Rhodopirellula europaea SH398 TaxID=1263868 RepID=M5S093_9BACT|nr:hypothetical protein RESH_04519 [Rhodopirellula europaea SH398]